MSHLEVLPLHVLVGFTVCDDDSRLVASYGQALIILHQLVGFIDAEQLHRVQGEKPESGSWCERLDT